MTRETVRLAYADIVASGLLNKQEGEVLMLLVEHGAATQNEADRYFGTNSHHKRFARLEELGLIRAAGTTADRITGKQNTVFELTGKTTVELAPERAQARLTRKERDEGLEEVCRAISYAADHGYTLSEPLERFVRWLFDKMPESDSL